VAGTRAACHAYVRRALTGLAEGKMRQLLLFLSIALGVSGYPYDLTHAQGPAGAPTPTTSPSAKARPRAQTSTAENCGTPDEPKPCPPLPRHPLQNYPGNKQ
jgi:hypothetical protein